MTKRLTAWAVLLMMLIGCTGCAHTEGGVTVPEIKHIKQYEIPQNEAMAFMQRMGVGWNLGNTFDAFHDGFRGDDLAMESIWVGVKTTREMIAAVREAGFGTIRIPVSWHNHVDENFLIREEWLARVQEVVDWALEEGLYVILNTHHDVGADFYYPNTENADVSRRYIRTIWEQLSARFAAYDERLIFESMNEPRLKDTEDEWVFNASKATCADAAENINQLNQLFVDTVRASGGANASRYLMVPGYAASADGALNEHFHLPADAADNRIIVSVHAYTPYSFALQDGGTDTFKLTDIGQTSEINRFMNTLYKTYVANGIPVVIGEFGARDKGGNLLSRVTFAAYYTANATARNMPCVWWDNNGHDGSGELFGLLNRKECSWAHPEIVEALVEYRIEAR